MTSFSSENEAKNLQNGDVHLAQVPDFIKCDISRAIWRIQVSDCPLFCIFHAFSFERNLFFDRTCPLRFKVSSIINLFLNFHITVIILL